MFSLFLLHISLSFTNNNAKTHYPDGAVLTIIDGFGESAWLEGNGIHSSDMPFLNYLKSNYPYQSLVAAQQPVGLIANEPGSSAVGHQTLGLGRTTPSYYQILERSLNRNSPDSLVNNKVLHDGLRGAKRAHFVGLCTDEGIFSHIKFLTPMFEAAIMEDVSEVYVHCILTSLVEKPSKYLKDVENLFSKSVKEFMLHSKSEKVNTVFRIAAIYSGETAMSKTNWSETQVAYDAMVDSTKLTKMPKSKAFQYLDSLNQVVPIFNPICVYDDNTGSESDCEKSVMKENEPVIYFHYREDKSYQLAKALIEGMPQSQKNPKLKVLPLILYHPSLLDKAPTIIPAVKYPNSLASWISQNGFKQLRVAESYKTSHATTFFSGGVLQPIFEGEERNVDFESVSEAVADLYPKMNATLVSQAAVAGINKKSANGENYYKFVFVNFANVDATGHTGNETAVRIACNFVDQKLKEIYDACVKNNFALFVCSDHGNGEEMITLDGKPQIFHTVNNVPFIAVYNSEWRKNKKENDDVEEDGSQYSFEMVANKNQFKVGRVPFIGNVAPSILYALGMQIPPEMEPPIIRRKSGNSPSKKKLDSSFNLHPNSRKEENLDIHVYSLSLKKQNAMILIGFVLGIITSILTLLMCKFVRANNSSMMNNDRRDLWAHPFLGN